MLQLHPMYTRQIESRNVSSETNRFKTIAYNSVYSPTRATPWHAALPAMGNEGERNPTPRGFSGPQNTGEDDKSLHTGGRGGVETIRSGFRGLQKTMKS